MKRLLVLVAVISAFVVTVSAQPRAIGGRLGYGVEVSYQHGFGDKNMLQLDFGLPGFGGLEAVATYNWVFPITSWKEQGSWNWYAGVGGGLGFDWWRGYSNVFVGVAGMIGVEYNFNFPLQLSIDYRPLIGPQFNSDGAGFHTDGFYSGAFAVSARYKF